jgi:hypothetical protein
MGKISSISALTAFFLLSVGNASSAQTAQPGVDIPVPHERTCPPGTRGGPTIGSGQSEGNLSEQLAQSKGIICPPAGVDPEMQVAPPQEGRTPIIKPPGTPGGTQDIQPK